MQENQSKSPDPCANNYQYDIENLWDWAEIMHKEINLQDYPNGWFGRHTKCCLGKEIFKWLMEKGQHD